MLWAFLSAEHTGSTLQWKKALLPSNLISLSKALTVGKKHECWFSACASLTCESRAYSVILRQKGSAQQGTAVYLTAFHFALLHQPRSFYYSEATVCWWALRHQCAGGLTLNLLYTHDWDLTVRFTLYPRLIHHNSEQGESSSFVRFRKITKLVGREWEKLSSHQQTLDNFDV